MLEVLDFCRFRAGFKEVLEGFCSQQDLVGYWRSQQGFQWSQENLSGLSRIQSILAGSQEDLIRILEVIGWGLSRILVVLAGFWRSQLDFRSQQDYRGLCISQQDFRCLIRILEVLGGFQRDFSGLGSGILRSQQDFRCFTRTLRGFQWSQQDLRGLSRVYQSLSRILAVWVGFRKSQQEVKGLSRILWDFRGCFHDQQDHRIPDVLPGLYRSWDLGGFSRIIEVLVGFRIFEQNLEVDYRGFL